MQYASPAAARGRWWIIVTQWKQRDSGSSFGYECGNSVPHLFIPSLESEDIHVPVGGMLHIAHGERHVIDSFQLHGKFFARTFGFLLWVNSFHPPQSA